jgi:hypothetical protein
VQNEQNLFVDLDGQIQAQESEPATRECTAMEFQGLDLLVD